MLIAGSEKIAAERIMTETEKIIAEIRSHTAAIQRDLATKSYFMLKITTNKDSALAEIVKKANKIVGRKQEKVIKQGRSVTKEQLDNLITLLIWCQLCLKNGFRSRNDDWPGNWAKEMYHSDGSGLPEGYFQLFKLIYDT